MILTETIEQTLLRLGFCVLTGTTPEILVSCIRALILRMADSKAHLLPDLSGLSSITAESLLPFNDAPPGYLWLLNVYLRGDEMLFETGICTQEKIDSLAVNPADKFTSPAKFAAWEAKQTVERGRKTIGIALRDFSRKALPNGVHMAYILGHNSGNHITVMSSEKRMYYFNNHVKKPQVHHIRHDSKYCSMTHEQFVATRIIFESIARSLAAGERGHVRAALAWMENPDADLGLGGFGGSGGFSSWSRW